MRGFSYKGFIDYPGVGKITDKHVYEVVKKHSRCIDRLNPKKMTEMSLLSQSILMNLYKNIDPKDMSWTFYGKNSLLKLDDWG